MTNERHRLTRTHYEELRAELKEKEEVDRPALAKRLHAAIAMGDLKENAEYIEAKERQGFLEMRIKDLKNILNNAVVIDESDLKIVTVVEEGETDSETYQIVSSVEANPAEGKISNESPLGKALLNAKKGDTVTVDAPEGKIVFKVVKVE